MVDYLCSSGDLDSSTAGHLSELCSHVFADYGVFEFRDVRWVLRNMPDVTVRMALADDALIGFKIGYAETRTRYYSYLGGVRETHRRRGIARRLALDQHAWATRHGYAAIETGAIESNTPMIELNLSLGFRVIGGYQRTDLPRVRMFREL